MEKKKFYVLIILVFVLSSCSSSPKTSSLSGDKVVNAFKTAGLEAENPIPMVADDYGLAPYVCKGTHFFIPSIAEGAGGRIFICDKKADQDRLAKYYNDLGKSSAMFFSWVFVKGNVLVQINGDLDETIARKYEQAIPGE